MSFLGFRTTNYGGLSAQENPSHCPKVLRPASQMYEKGTGLLYNPRTDTVHCFETHQSIETMLLAKTLVKPEELVVLRTPEGFVPDPQTYLGRIDAKKLNLLLRNQFGLNTEILERCHDKQQRKKTYTPALGQEALRKIVIRRKAENAYAP